MRDDDVRSSCFAALDVLQAQHGPELPYSELAQGFNFRSGPAVRGRRPPEGADLEVAGIELIGMNERDSDWEWIHVGGPDGNLYELASRRELVSG